MTTETSWRRALAWASSVALSMSPGAKLSPSACQGDGSARGEHSCERQRRGRTNPISNPERRYVMATFAVIAEHPPELCPTSNARTRQMLKEGAAQIPQLAEQLGIDIVTLRVFGPEHIVLAVVEANDIEVVRDFILQSRLIQWNTTKIHATYSMEEALAKSDELEAIF
jgi:hypothetical protein